MSSSTTGRRGASSWGLLGAAALLGLQTACLEYGGATVSLDLIGHHGVMTWHDLRSSADGADPEGTVQEDLAQVVDTWATADATAAPPPELGFTAWTVHARHLVEHEGHLDGVISFGWLGGWTDSYDAKLPIRYCLPTDQRVVRTNARARERSGCLLWSGTDAELLLEAATVEAPEGRSLLEAWKAKGSPGAMSSPPTP